MSLYPPKVEITYNLSNDPLDPTHSVAFPHSNEVLNATPLLRPPHLPFRRMSLPAGAKTGLFINRLSLASTTSLESTGVTESTLMVGENKPTTPTRNGRRRYTSSNRPLSKETAVINKEMSQKRRKIINEILDTEQVYVDGLNLIYSNFLTPLIDSLETSHPILSRSEITTLFSNFLDIWNLNRSLLISLTDLLVNRDDPPLLSPIFMSHFPYLSLYTPFVTAFPSALTNLSRLMASNPAFSDFIRKQEADPRCGRLTLRDWLLTIVQRCPRYLLLSKDLISCTDPSDPEHEALVQAHAVLSKITQSLNTSLRVHSQTISLLSLQRATVNPPFQFVQPGRVFIRRGSLWQGQAEKNAPALREFLLFSDYLVWLAYGDERMPDKRLLRPRLNRGRSRSETELPNPASRVKHALSEEVWTCKGCIALLDIEVVITSVSQDTPERVGFDVLSPQVSFAVYAATEDERELWVTEIRNAKAALLASLSMMDTNSTFTSSQATTHLRRVLQALPDENDSDSQKRSRVEHFLPAVWVPDSKTDNCMRCKAKFAWRRRRHHCRLCGRCVCADCSTKTFLISDTSTKDTKRARSCNVCYETVFPVLQDLSESVRQNSGEESLGDADTNATETESAIPDQTSTDNTDNNSTLGTLPKLPNFHSALDVRVARRTAPALLKPPAVHDLSWNPHLRPLSQPVMSPIDVDATLPDAFHVTSFSEHRTGRRPFSSSTSQAVVPQLRHQTSTPALAITTETITVMPISPGANKGKRFSFSLSGKKASKAQAIAQEAGMSEQHGPAMGKLSEILSREKRENC